MNNKRLILALIGLALFLALVYVVVQSQQSKITKVEYETILIGKGSSPKWSPDGSKIAFIAEDGWLTITDVEREGEIKKIAQANFSGFDWLDSNTFLTYQREYKEEQGVPKKRIMSIKTLTMDGKEGLIKEDISSYNEPPQIKGVFFLEDGTVGYYEGGVYQPDGNKTLKIIKPGKLKPENATKELKAVTRGDIWLESLDGTIKKKITSGTYYRGARLSPDGTKIMTHNSRGDILILDLQGNVLSSLGVGVYEGWTPDKGAGGSERWSPDSKQIVYALMVESEYDIEASDLFIVNWDGTDKRQITDTPNEIELVPIWSPDGAKILCRSDNTNNIFVIKVK